MGTLRLYIKQQDHLNIKGQQIHYAGINPQSLAVVNGPLPPARQWPGNGSCTDMTDFVSDLQELQLTWTEDRDSTGTSTPGAYQHRKGVSGTITFESDAYNLVKQWLIDDVSAPLNAVAVKLHDTGCDIWYEGYEFKATDIRWCEGSLCSFDITLRQRNEPLNCIKRTLINDNWQGWFYRQPWNAKKHPRFSYCNEQRPNGMLVMLWWIMGTFMGPMLLVMIPLLFVLNIVFAIINVIIGVIQTIVNIVGGSSPSTVNWQTIPYFDFQAMLDSMGQFFVESVGCGREHPAPLIRDYIQNVCDKCGVKVDADTAPIFFATHLKIETSGRGMIETLNHHHNACYLNLIEYFTNIGFKNMIEDTNGVFLRIPRIAFYEQQTDKVDVDIWFVHVELIKYIANNGLPDK